MYNNIKIFYKIHWKFFQITPDSHCLASAILSQIVHHNNYTCEMAMRQVGFHMLKHPEKFYTSIENELIETGESYESYCYNVFHSHCWGNDLVAAAFRDMWNVSISIVSPSFKYAIDLWHNAEEPDIMLIANGGSYLAEHKKMTHFSTTRFIDPDHRKPGYDLVNKAIRIDPLVVYKKLKPVLLHNADTARNSAIEAYAKSQKEQSLKLLYSTTRNIERLDAEIAHMIWASDKKKDQLKKLQYQLILLGVSNEKIEIATKHKEVPYMLTEEVERDFIREERKQKQEEEEQEAERKKCKWEMIVVKDGKVISGGDTGEKVEEEGDTTHVKTLIQQ